MSERILGGTTERIEAVVLDGSLAPLTGLTTVVVSIRRASDDTFYDFNDFTFKASGWTTRQQQMSEIDSANAPGEYAYDWDTSAMTNPERDDTYEIRVDETTSAANVPQVGELKIDQWVAEALGMRAV
jgi:hypothetical protein